MPEMNYEPLQVVEPDDEYKQYQYLRRTSSTVKVIAVIHWVRHQAVNKEKMRTENELIDND
jgi:uncharacterized membrane protein